MLACACLVSVMEAHPAHAKNTYGQAALEAAGSCCNVLHELAAGLALPPLTGWSGPTA